MRRIPRKEILRIQLAWRNNTAKFRLPELNMAHVNISQLLVKFLAVFIVVVRVFGSLGGLAGFDEVFQVLKLCRLSRLLRSVTFGPIL